MNTKKLIKWIELIIFAIILAFLIPVIFKWIQSGLLEITSSRNPKSTVFRNYGSGINAALKKY